MENYFNIIFGALIGFGLSLLLQLFNHLMLKRRALSLLKLEYPEISKILTGLVNSAEKVNGIISTEIPNFRLVMQTEYLLRLRKSIRDDVYSVYKQLEHAERLRLIAHPLIGDSNKYTELNAYGMLYKSCLKAAYKEMNNLSEKL